MTPANGEWTPDMTTAAAEALRSVVAGAYGSRILVDRARDVIVVAGLDPVSHGAPPRLWGTIGRKAGVVTEPGPLGTAFYVLRNGAAPVQPEDVPKILKEVVAFGEELLLDAGADGVVKVEFWRMIRDVATPEAYELITAKGPEVARLMIWFGARNLNGHPDGRRRYVHRSFLRRAVELLEAMPNYTSIKSTPKVGGAKPAAKSAAKPAAKPAVASTPAPVRTAPKRPTNAQRAAQVREHLEAPGHMSRLNVPLGGNKVTVTISTSGGFQLQLPGVKTLVVEYEV